MVDSTSVEPFRRVRLKNIATCNDDVLSELTNDFYEIDYVEISGVSIDKGIFVTSRYYFYQAPSRARRIVQAGDVLISTVRTYLKAITVIPETEKNLVVSTGFCVIRAGFQALGEYLGWALKTNHFISEVMSRSVGVSYPAITSQEIMRLSIPLPHLEKQRQIAEYLDRKTAQIDALIAKKQELLDRLAEKRQALITQAVTKGLDPDVPMKDSGIDWIGQIPAHWEVVQLRHLIKTKSGDALTNKDMSEAEEDSFCVPVIGGNGIMGYAEYSNIEESSVVIGRVGALCGNVHISPKVSWVTDNAISVRIISKFYLKYLYYVLLSRNLNDLSNRNAQPLITGEMVRSEFVPIPPMFEQINIGERIEVINSLRSDEMIQKSITFLQEYRSALITSSVTHENNDQEVANHVFAH